MSQRSPTDYPRLNPSSHAYTLFPMSHSLLPSFWKTNPGTLMIPTSSVSFYVYLALFFYPPQIPLRIPSPHFLSFKVELLLFLFLSLRPLEFAPPRPSHVNSPHLTLAFFPVSADLVTIWRPPLCSCYHTQVPVRLSFSTGTVGRRRSLPTPGDHHLPPSFTRPPWPYRHTTVFPDCDLDPILFRYYLVV